ncbi:MULTISPECIES: nucleotide sugar dehydrogenase [unclassified Solwaraspora]|uniref:nucleotide sugar dehydrogenase n=1 Tax=unclassified Solwaraspora TaxID=2627926 RepID=UPI00248CFE29|nr:MULTISPECIES: nucleotide sugar dehydrogenase [unclassified Solwaraspora]WBB99652.1 nucleotide sugar dehydrogenase [Solwaraspora sp. WMMA2059]WBC21798.1 nucleotide sugar dehydrogenase [Solwaraspora sp. WMMA2080]WJK36155.1 nucleotide sugar dehydrogenase [Solwaraspora sp. WMMA2065]
MANAPVVIVGQGYVGLPVAMRAVEVGHRVVGLDTDTERIRMLRAGTSYVQDVTDAELHAALGSGRYTATTDYAAAAGFDTAVITVPTPLRDGAPDLRYIEQAARSLAEQLTPGATVILESTTYPGTTDEFLRPLLEKGSGLQAGLDFHLGYSPERIDPGNHEWNFVNTPKVVSGITPESLRSVRAFYDGLVDRTVPVTGTREAETTKLLENTFRHVNIALVNELAVYAHMLGIDIWDAIDAASTKPFGFLRFTPGPGVGGHCLPVDPSYLSWEVKRTLGRNFRFVELANDVNNYMPMYVVERLTSAMNRRSRALRGARVLLIGLAYKRNSGDCRESPAVRVAELLHLAGAQLHVVDPHLRPEQMPAFVQAVPLTVDQVEAADAVVVLTDHDGIDYSLLSAAPLVLDTRRRLAATAGTELL